MGCLLSSCVTDWRKEAERLEVELHLAQTRLQDAHAAAAWESVDRAEKEVARRYECKVCFQAPISLVFLPCGHAMCCLGCGNGRGTCPTCASPVEDATTIHVL